MRDLEKYYGVKISKRMTLSRMLSRSKRYKARQTAERLLKEVNVLFVRGLYDQCLSMLEQAVRLAPNDARPFYTLGLIHEELGNAAKAQTSFFVCALLKRSDTTMWRKVLSAAAAADDCRSQAVALEKICRREPSEALLVRKMECLQRLNKRFWVIGCEIELFDYRGVDCSVFDRFRDIHHLITIRRICKRLVKCIHRNRDAQGEYFVRNTVYNLYKLKDWETILALLGEFYLGTVESPAPEIRLIACIARARLGDAVKDKAHGRHAKGPGAAAPDALDGIIDSCIHGLHFLSDEIPELGRSLLDGASRDTESDDGECGGQDGSSSAPGARAVPGDKKDRSDSDGDGTGAWAGCEIDVLEIESLISDDCLWRDLAEPRYANDLADLLQASGRGDWGIRLLERLYLKSADTQTRIKIADFFSHGGDAEAALKHYSEALGDDPTNVHVRAKLYETYCRMGNAELAKVFETSMQTYQYAVSAAGEIKKNYRYTSDKCRGMRSVYSESNRVLLDDFRRYPECTEPLLEDFFSNAFVIVKNKNFRCFLNKYERVEREKGIVPREETLSKRKMTEKLIRISSLHGLDTEEWFYIIKNNVVCMVHCGRYREARRLVRRSLEAYVLRDLCYTLPLSLLGIKVALYFGDFETVVQIVKGLATVMNYSASYLLYFLCNFVPDFYHYSGFNSFQKNVQRVGRRSMHRAGCGLPEARHAAAEEAGPPDAQDRPVLCAPAGREERITPFLIVNSYIPRYLFTETVDDIASLGQDAREEVVIILSSIHLAHSKSRVLVDRMKYARAGIKMLHGLAGSSLFRVYNLAKAYHFYGCYPKAEAYYLEVIGGDNDELRRMSVFNLSLIFKKNKSRKVLHRLLSKAR